MEKNLQVQASNELAQRHVEATKAALTIVEMLEMKVAQDEQDAIAAAGAHADEKIELEYYASLLEAQLAAAKARAECMEEEKGKLSHDLKVANAKIATSQTDLGSYEEASAAEKRDLLSDLTTAKTARNDLQDTLDNVTKMLSARLAVAGTCTECGSLKVEALAEKLTTALSTAEVELAALTANNIDLRAELEDAKNALHACKHAVNGEQERSQLLTIQVADLTQGLGAAIQAKDAEKTVALANATSQALRLVTLKCQLTKSKGMGAEAHIAVKLEADLEAAHNELEAIREERDAQTVTVEKLRHCRKASSEALRLVTLKCEQLTKSKEMGAAERARLKCQLTKSDGVVAKVREELEDAKLEVAAATAEAQIVAKLEADLEAAVTIYTKYV